MTDKFLGYQVATDDMTLISFLARARQEYTTLEEAIAPLDEKIKELQKNWYPSTTRFWRTILEKEIPAIQKATRTCLNLFGKERSTKEAPAPIIISATSLGYLIDLQQIEHEIEEAGILLTASLCNTRSQSAEQEIRAERRLLDTLQRLNKATHEALEKGRAKLNEAMEEQARLLAPPKQTQTEDEQPQVAAKRKPRQSRVATRPVLRVVSDEEGAE